MYCNIQINKPQMFCVKEASLKKWSLTVGGSDANSLRADWVMKA